jgi:hypothetical protein
MSFTAGLLFFAIAAGIMTVLFKLPLWLFILTVISISLARTAYVLHVLYRSQNVKRIDRFLQSAIKNPLYHYTYSVKTGSIQAQIQAIDLVLTAYRSPLVQGMYRTNKAILTHDYNTAKDFASQIPNELMRNYHLGLVEAAQGHEKAKNFLVQKPWMSSMVAATLSYKKGNMQEFELLKKEVLAQSRGIQYFSNFYYLNRIDEKIKVTKKR